jgi:hypothetical protein
MLALACIAGAVFVAVEASAGPALDQAEIRCVRNVCTVRNNPGGDIEIFRRAARELLAERKRLVIDGECASACVILADIARAHTCITPRARMAVHKSTVVRFTGRTAVDGREAPVAEIVRREDPPQSPDIDRWVKRHGGYPINGVLVMPVRDARQFWPAC